MGWVKWGIPLIAQPSQRKKNWLEDREAKAVLVWIVCYFHF